MKNNAILIVAASLWCAFLYAQDTYDSGVPLIPEQAAYDVTFYDLKLNIDPVHQSISGSNSVTARILSPLNVMVLDFDALFVIDSVLVRSASGQLVRSDFERKDSRVWIDLQRTPANDSLATCIVFYHGRPREAPNPPWSGGFTWARTPANDPWISVSCENNGADIWWPCKDQPSDEPDSMAMHFTVPAGLTCISNGQLRGVTKNSDQTQTFFWFVSTPVNNYGITFYAAPYETESIPFTSVTGESFPMAFVHLAGNRDDYKELIAEIPRHVAFFENLLGPYPFRVDKYYVVQAPYLGMEHQTCIAYGAPPGYHYGGYHQDFDGLHLHELAHEWWGNMITASDWKDFWLHEGFATYMEALYAEHLNGFAGYQDVMQSIKSMSNRAPIAPLATRSTSQVYGIDIYYKGAWVLHTLRTVLGDDLFFESLQRFLYPDPSLMRAKDGRQCRLVSTEDFINTVETISGRDLSWFFDVYVRRASLPVLQNYIKNKTLHLQWMTEQDIPFPMDVPVQVGANLVLVDMASGKGSLLLDPFVAPQIDPDERILKTMVRINDVDEPAEVPNVFALEQNYPNPFNSQTTIGIALPNKSPVRLTVHNLQGETVEVLFDGILDSGRHEFDWDASLLPSGVYSCKLEAGEFVDVKKLTLVK